MNHERIDVEVGIGSISDKALGINNLLTVLDVTTKISMVYSEQSQFLCHQVFWRHFKVRCLFIKTSVSRNPISGNLLSRAK